MTITNALLDAYIDDQLNEQEINRIEKALRDSPELQKRLETIIKDRDQGEHSVGAIWRREHLSCPNREELSSYGCSALDKKRMDYIKFHLEMIGCKACQANLDDLTSLNASGKEKKLSDKQKLFIKNSKIIASRKE